MIQRRRKQWERSRTLNPSSPAQNMDRIMVALVKANDDPQRMGRLRVWIPELGGDENEERHWFTVSYASPFAGSTSPRDLTKNGQDMDSSSRSYGWWATPPHLENQVLVCFANGDPAKGFWFACLYQQNMNHMVPGIPANTTIDQTDQPIAPTVEYNRWSDGEVDDPPRPIFTPLHEGLTNQGLYTDDERGPSSAGARREAPSGVTGFLSPGGHQIYSDDSEDNGHIRLRTRGGAQVLINDATGYIYVISKGGTSWLEISDSGIDVYSGESISMRSEKDINLHADQNINLHAAQNINGYAGASIITNAGTNIESKAGSNIVESAGSNISAKAGASHLTTAGGNISASAGGNHTVTAGGQSTRHAGTIHDNSGSSTTANAPEASSISVGEATGVSTSTSRAPSHEPWPGHPSRHSGATAQNASVNQDGERTITTGEGRQVAGPEIPDNSPRTEACGGEISANVLSAIREGARVGGVDLGYMLAKAGAESSFDPNIGARTSSAKGLYQFTRSTWAGMVERYGAQYNIGIGDIYNARANAIMGGLFAAENKRRLEAAGFQASPRNLYITHFLGPTGGPNFLRSSRNRPNDSIRNHVSESAFNANRGLFVKNGRTLTVQEFMNEIDRRITTKSRCYANRFSGQ